MNSVATTVTCILVKIVYISVGYETRSRIGGSQSMCGRQKAKNSRMAPVTSVSW